MRLAVLVQLAEMPALKERRVRAVLQRVAQLVALVAEQCSLLRQAEQRTQVDLLGSTELRQRLQVVVLLVHMQLEL